MCVRVAWMVPHPWTAALLAGGRKERHILLTLLPGKLNPLPLQRIPKFPWWGCPQPCSHQEKKKRKIRGERWFYFAVEIISELVTWETFPGMWLHSKLLEQIGIHLVSKMLSRVMALWACPGAQQKWQESDGQLLNEGKLKSPHLWARMGSLMRAGITSSCSEGSYFVASSIPVRELWGGCLCGNDFSFSWHIILGDGTKPWVSLEQPSASSMEDLRSGAGQSPLWWRSDKNDFRIKQHLWCLSSENWFWAFFSPVWCSPFFRGKNEGNKWHQIQLLLWRHLAAQPWSKLA